MEELISGLKLAPVEEELKQLFLLTEWKLRHLKPEFLDVVICLAKGTQEYGHSPPLGLKVHELLFLDVLGVFEVYLNHLDVVNCLNQSLFELLELDILLLRQEAEVDSQVRILFH